VSCQSRQVEQQADGRFVEDRTYKVLIVDSVMNLFSQSAYGRGTGAELIYRTRLLWSRRIIRTSTGQLPGPLSLKIS